MAIRKIDLTNNTFGVERRQDILDGISENGTYLPQAVLYDDIDRAMIDFVDGDVDLYVEQTDNNMAAGLVKVPVFFFTIQKWGEFTKSWSSSDEFKDVKMPFITVVREPDIQQGTNQNQFWNVPGRRTWTYFKVPTFNNNRVGMDLYKIPQPTSVDLTYNVRFFSNRMQELNALHNIIQRKFNARQYYINVKGHPMPLILETVQDESKIEDIDARKYYVQTFEIICKGYILDDKDFEIVPAVDRSTLAISAGGEKLDYNQPRVKKNLDLSNNGISYMIDFKHDSYNIATIKMDNDAIFSGLSDEYNISTVQFFVNGVGQILPFSVRRNDEIHIKIDKLQDFSASIKFYGKFNTFSSTSIVIPQNNTNFPSDPNIYIQVEYMGTPFNRIEYFADDLLIEVRSIAPFEEVTWYDVPDGIYSLIAKTYDDQNNLISISEPTTVIVGNVDTAIEFILTDDLRLYTDG